MKEYIKTLSTKELCDELALLEGVETVVIMPYKAMVQSDAIGSAIVFIVTD